MLLLGAARAAFAAESAAPRIDYPSDVNADSGNRLPLVKRESLDPAGQKTYDQLNSPSGGSLAGLRGPGGILLYSPELSQLNGALNRFLRGPDTGLSAHVRELAILVIARQFNSEFEWAAHEPVALKEGVSPRTVDVVKRRKALRRIPEGDAIVIELGREAFGNGRVSKATYARAIKQLSPRGVINLVALMGNYAGTAALLATFNMQLPPGERSSLPVSSLPTP
jgi:4-carboxymuconolactone decarboxylase